jgi:hypothetical protein
MNLWIDSEESPEEGRKPYAKMFALFVRCLNSLLHG